MQLSVVILAAGQSKRMRSALPKMLHTLGGKSLLTHVVAAAQAINPSVVYVVYGHCGEQVRQQLGDLPVQWVKQDEQLGTGHAVAQALPVINTDQVLVLVGDIPLIDPTTLQKLLNITSANELGLITANMPDPSGYGRIVRDAAGKIIRIIEDKDLAPEQRSIQEINTGIILVPAKALQRWLPTLNNNNKQGEYYLPDIIPLAISEGMAVKTIVADTWQEVQGINDRAQLAFLERYYQQQTAKKLMLSGVTIIDPARLDIRGEVTIAVDVTLDINIILEGKVTIGTNSYIGPNVILRNVKIGNNVHIKANSVIEDAEIGDDCIIGPFARIRPGTRLTEKVHVGNFVEIKNSLINAESKINHLSYIGDTTMGKKVNIGAGTITCNYDGINKWHTTIEDGAFIGSNTQLVAPVTVGANATIGAGSTITRDAPPDALTLSRAQQKSITKWQRGRKK